MTDSVTQSWIVDASDELAIRNGCWFHPLSGAFAVWWIERYCRLYEGEWAGDPMHLRGRHDEPFDHWEIPDEFDEQLALERHEHFIDGYRGGVPCDWQYFTLMRLFSWKRESERWGRPVRRFRQGSVWVPKKNKKSPTLAAIGLYLTCGDGEQGQKVAFAAKDGSQARDIAGKHAIEMVRASPELSAECKINLNEMQIEHIASRSFMKPFSSSNSRNQQAKEGFNGSILVDETHVVDRSFMKRLSRSGISRSEPMQLEVSTAGNNPDSYGKERFDYGAQVASGEIQNDQLCYIAYAAQQDVSGESLTDDEVIRLGKLANPAWGHTIGEEEFTADYQQSKIKVGDLLDFLMYRLNVWQHTVKRWISPDAWQGCGGPYTLDRFTGQSCTIGLDVSKSRDMTAAVLAFPQFGPEGVERVSLWPHFWLPEEYARKNASEADFEQWAADGWLSLTKGNEISIGEVYRDFERWAEQFTIMGLFYDPAFATHLTQILEQGMQSHDGAEIIRGLGITRTSIGQRSWQMSQALDDFEDMVINGRVEHPNSPVLNWQMGNANVKESNGRTVVEKPEKESVKKIDGVVAEVMALAGLNYCEPSTQGSIYDNADDVEEFWV